MKVIVERGATNGLRGQINDLRQGRGVRIWIPSGIDQDLTRLISSCGKVVILIDQVVQHLLSRVRSVAGERLIYDCPVSRLGLWQAVEGLAQVLQKLIPEINSKLQIRFHGLVSGADFLKFPSLGRRWIIEFFLQELVHHGVVVRCLQLTQCSSSSSETTKTE
jgi:hypothetical protein